MRKGFFISFEGIDNSGKDTHHQKLDTHLLFRGYDVVAPRVPGHTRYGQLMRELLGIGHGAGHSPSLELTGLIENVIGVHEMQDAQGNVSFHSLLNTDLDAAPRTESLIFLSAHTELIEGVIRPALEEGRVVLCNRFVDSLLAYQGYGKNENLERLRKVIGMLTGNLAPDLTFLFDITVKEMARRAAAREVIDRIEKNDPEFYGRVRQGYLELARLEPERWVIIDGTRSIDENQAEIQAAAEERMREAGVEPNRELLWGWRGRERESRS